ncbi:TIM-barrel domain-containing protein [Pedobacter lithocola]|uniref:TIM-barrel domain-containing protein n=1 Tax=Pedobacter lithocola TaxID=1908239 RepID=A0ABV8P6H0_9SPHI
MSIMRYISYSILICFFCTKLAAQKMDWQEIEPGVWKATIGKPERYNLLTASGVAPYHKGLLKLEPSKFPLIKSEITAKIVDGKTYLRFPLDKTEQLFGFGLNFKSVNQRGKILELHVDHYNGSDNGRTHAPTPFYVSSKGYGIFINSARYLKIYAGAAVQRDSKNPPEVQDRNTDANWNPHPYSDGVEILVPAEGVEIYVLGGPTSMNAVQRFNLFNGGGCLPPRWGLGFTQRMERLTNAAEVFKEAADFEQRGYPLDFIGLEPGWQSKSYPNTFEWDKKRFPEPEKMVSALRKKNIRLNLWINPYVSPDAPFYKKLLPYTASHTVWAGVVPDIQTDSGKNILFGALNKNKVDIGISGYKIDEVDGGDGYLWPDLATFPSRLSAEQMRQTYGVLMQRYTTELYQQKNQRTYGLVRGSNAGGVSFPYVIYNDYYNHQDFITALINSGFAGVLWTPEVRASNSPEEWVRRFQSNVFSPMAMINAWASGTKPWTFPEVAPIIKEFALLRMQMMPYWYSEFAKYHFEGIPPFRAMNLENGFQNILPVQESKNNNLEENPYAKAIVKEIKDQYMAGENLLVAPIFTGQKSRTVILPKGKWFDFYTGKYVGDGEVITANPGLDKIPVYVKDGGIIPMMQPMLHAPKSGEKVDIEFRYYGSKPASYQFYDDDGETYNYEKGEFSIRTVKVSKVNGKYLGSITNPLRGQPNTTNKITYKMMTL